MRNINYMYTAVLLVITMTLTSCGSPYRSVKPNEVIQNKDISFVAPSAQFKIAKEYSSPKEIFFKKN